MRTSSPGAQWLRVAGVGAILALAGCRGILGIHDDEPTIDCLTASDCPLGEACGSGNTCVSRAGFDATDEPLVAVVDGTPANAEGGRDAEAGAAADAGPLAQPDADADGAAPDATVADATVTDATVTDAIATDATVTDAADTGDATANVADANDEDDANDEAHTANNDAADVETGPTVDNDTGDTCSVGPSGACAACTGACTVERPGWLPPEIGGLGTIVYGNTFIAAQITLAKPSWLMRLGIAATASGVTGQLALYTDSAGQPGELVTAVHVTIEDDPQNHDSEQSVPCNALCQPLAAGNYWIGALFDVTILLYTDGESNTTLYQATSASYSDAGMLDNGVVPAGTTSTGARDRNLYVVVTQP